MFKEHFQPIISVYLDMHMHKYVLLSDSYKSTSDQPKTGLDRL